MASIRKVYPALEKLGFQTVGNFCVGVWEGYTLTFVSTPWQWYEPLHSLYINARLRASDKETPRRINKNRFKRGFYGWYPCTNTGHGLCFANLWFHTNPWISYEKQFLNMMNQVLPSLHQHGIESDRRCAICKGNNPESLGNVWGIYAYQPVHRACVERRQMLGMAELKEQCKRRQRHAVVFPKLVAHRGQRTIKGYEKSCKKQLSTLLANPEYKTDVAEKNMEYC